jgi:hypothetical protein
VNPERFVNLYFEPYILADFPPVILANTWEFNNDKINDKVDNYEKILEETKKALDLISLQ